jgi:hypothetical protein
MQRCFLLPKKNGKKGQPAEPGVKKDDDMKMEEQDGG